MKLKIAYYFVCAALAFCLPMMAASFDVFSEDRALPEASEETNISESKTASESGTDETTAHGQSAEGKSLHVPGGSMLRILDDGTGKVLEVSLYDYVRGAIAAELPPSFHEEALAAQGVASLTLALRLRQEALAAGDEHDFSADPGRRLGYTTQENARADYGESFAENWARVTRAADKAMQYVVAYDGEPIFAAYHAISGGVTESAENIWGGVLPYLVPVESPGDLLAPEYETEVVLTPKEMSTALLTIAPEAAFDGDPAVWFGEPKVTASGYVLQIEAGGVFFTGVQIREALGLRSGAFTVEHGDEGFVLTVRGYGHGVGLSQRGAEYMARQGADFEEILEHYYKGAELCLLELAD